MRHFISIASTLCLTFGVARADEAAPPPTPDVAATGGIIESVPAPADLPMRCAFGDAGLGSLYVTTGEGQLFRCSNSGRKGLKR